MNGKLKNTLWLLMAVVLVAVCAVWFLTDGVEHIDDTNGPEDSALAVITDGDIIAADWGAVGLTRSTDAISGTVRFHSDRFSGVREIMWTDVLFSTGTTLQIIDFQVNAGNFKMAVVNDGEIIRVISPGEDLIDLGSVEGRLSLVIAGESADFSFRLFRHDYDSYAHLD